jgi:hypothetical protein
VQQYSIMAQEGRTNPHQVRHHHAQDLLQFVKNRQAEGDLICVCRDFNESIGDNNQGLTKLCSKCMLTGVVFETHGYGNNDFNTYIQGNRCIDYMLMNRQLVQAVQYCRYKPFNIRIMGDHRGLYVDISTTDMFGSETIALPPLALRDYCAKNIHQTAPFIHDQFQHLEDYAWFQQINILQECIDQNEPNHTLANKLDKQRIAACQYAGKKLK